MTTERLAKAELDREERLFQQKITAKADVQSARAAFAAANAQREAAENRLYAVGIGHEVLDRLDGAKDGATDGTTPLHIACEEGSVDVVRLLLDNGAEVDRANECGDTPLFIAELMGHSAVVALLEEHRK